MQLFSKDGIDVEIDITTHQEEKVILSTKSNETLDALPWITDVKHEDKFCFPKMSKDEIVDNSAPLTNITKGIVRGGNRIKIYITQPGKYELAIPHDADLITKLDANVNYYSTRDTELHVESREVNHIGSSGGCWYENGRSYQKWDYSDGDTLTKIVTNKTVFLGQ